MLMNNRERKNPTSAIRAGLDYQDIWGFNLCAEWMKNPDKYKWIQFETIPSEVTIGRFYLDDIVLCDKSDLYYVYQIKHKQNPDTDRWKWDDLLNPQIKSGQSLIKKWYDSYFKQELKDRINSAKFVTNGSAHTEIKKYLKNAKINIEEVKKDLPGIYSKIKKQLGDVRRIKRFFAEFQFIFDQADLEKLEEKIASDLMIELGATQNGITNLLWQIHKECRQKYTRPLTLEQMREWCEWDTPEPLNEKFEIPCDFVLFDKVKHNQILRDLKNPIGGIKVIYGKPGCGKSTYLSKLYETLYKGKVITIRHHYHISPEDENPSERLNSNRVIEAIKAQIKQYPKELGRLAHKNSKNVSIREYLGEVAKTLNKKNKTFVFIIDGLDHVLRHGYVRELKDFLNKVVFPQPGLWIIFGTQTIAKEYLPQIVFDKCPEDEWVEVKGIGKKGLSQILDTNIIGLNITNDRQRKKEITSELFQLNEGNPLHLRYLLRELKNKIGNGPLTVFDLKDLLPYSGDIRKYYSSLWNKICVSGKTLAILIASAGFTLEKRHLIEILQSFENNPSKITKGFNSIYHLLNERKNIVSIYHNSFMAFIQNQREYEEQEKLVKRHLKNWIETSDNDELKWSELRRLTYDLGDSKPILELNRDWLVDAICDARRSEKIISQLKLGAKASFEERLFDKTFELSTLNIYYKNHVNFVNEAYEKIWEEAFKRKKVDIYKLKLDEFSSKQLQVIANLAEEQGMIEVIDDVVEILRERHADQKYSKKGDIGAYLPEISKYLMITIPFDRNHVVGHIHKYVKQFRDIGWSSDLFKIYVGSLLETEQFTKISELLTLDLTKDEKQAILDKCAEYDFESQNKKFLEAINSTNHRQLSYFCLLYLLIQGKRIKYVPALPKYEWFPSSIKEYETGKRENNSKIFSQNFSLGIIYALLKNEKEVEAWIDNAENRWALQIMSKIFEASLQIGQNIEGNYLFDYKIVFKKLASVRKLDFPKDRHLYELQFSLEITLSSILKLIRLLKLKKHQSNKICKEELNTIVSSKFYSRSRLIEFLLSLDTPCLSMKANKSFLQSEKSKWKEFITSFPERAEHYADLAKLASIHGDKRSQKELLKLATSNFLGYGNHKDMYLDEVLHSIHICHKAGSKKANEWIKRIIPTVENITEYTDGDETRYFPRDLARILVTISPKMLYKYYYQKAQDEELFLAQDIFKYILHSLKFIEDKDVALATSALDETSFNELKALSKNKKAAQQALQIIEDYFGNIEYQSKTNVSSSYTLSKKSQDYSNVKPKELKKHLDTLKTRWEQREFLVPWSKYWLKRNGEKKSKTCQILASIIEKDGINNAEGELLDLLYPLVYKIDKSKAFDYVCWAQANDNGWSLYWTYKKKAEKRWIFIKRRYPDRYMEFFKKSIIYTGKGYGRGERYFIPIPRGIEFLLLFDNLELVENITEASVGLAESLMANLKIETPTWVKESKVTKNSGNNGDIDVLDILFQRLIWPSPLVRERAADGIAGLLATSQNKKTIFKRLLRWIERQKLESVIVLGLLPMLKAVARKTNELKYIELQKVIDSLPHTSIVIEKLIIELSRLLDTQVDFKINRKNIEIAPSNYNTSEFFIKHITGFLAPIYLQRAQKIDEKTGGFFVRQWAYTSSWLMEECGLKERVGDAMYFMGGDNTPILAGMSSALSEVYRSSFLRVLQDFYEKDLLDKNIYLKYAYSTMPIELSYWKVKAGRAPRWWPKMAYDEPQKDEKSGLIKISYHKNIEKIVGKKDKYLILGIDGPIKPAKGWISEQLKASVTTVAFGYKISGSNFPSEEEVAKEILYWPSTFILPGQVCMPFNFLESYNDHISTVNAPIKLGDLSVYPLVARNVDLVINLWQWYRNFPLSFGLSKDLAHGTKIRLKSNGWKYLKDKTVIAKSSDWVEGIKEKYDKDLEIPHGQYIKINSSFLNSYLKENQLRLAHAIKTEYKYKEHSYKEAKVFKDYKLIGVSKIIV